MYHNYPMTLTSKTVHVNIKVIDAPLSYNILLGRSYTYTMSVVTPTIFQKMCFPHEGNIVTIDQLTYYEPNFVTSPMSIVSLMSNNQSQTPLTGVSPRVYKVSSLLGAFPGHPPLISKPNSMGVFMLQASGASLKKSITSNQERASQHPIVAIPVEPSGSTPQDILHLWNLSYVSIRNCSSRSQLSRSYSAKTVPCKLDNFLISPSRSIFCLCHGFTTSP